MEIKSYIPLHLHTHRDSVLDAIVKSELSKDGSCLLMGKARNYDIPAIAITGHGNMSGALGHYKACKEYGIKPIIGFEAYICKDLHEKGRYSHLILLAKNQEGYRNIKALCSIGYLEGFYNKPRIDFPTLVEHSEGVICMTACLAGDLPKIIMRDDYKPQMAIDYINQYRNVFGDDFYLEIQSSEQEDQIIVNKEIVRLAHELNIDFVVTTDVHFLDKEDAEIHNIYINIGKTKERDTQVYKWCYLQSRKEIFDILSKQIGEKDANIALDNTYKVSNKCNLELELHNPKLPHQKLPKGIDNETDWLEEEAWEGFEKRKLNDKENVDEYLDRMDSEFNVIETKGFEGYFLILMNIINEAKRRKIPIGEGRGSAAGSLIAYCLGITNVDPIEYDLDFGRFLTMERTELPDIDTDVATSRRGDLIDLISQMFGFENVAQVATFGTLASKAVIDAVGKVMNISKEVCSGLKTQLNEKVGVASLRDSKQYNIYKHFIEVCVKIEGLNRSYGCHAGAVCISGDNKPMIDYAPVMLNQDGKPMVQFEMHDTEDANLVKYDMLGLTSLDYIADALELIGSDYYSFKFDWNDKKTYDMLASGKNSGVFQADSNFAARVFTAVKPQNLHEVADCVAIGRPDSIKFLEPYVNAKFNGVKPEQIHPLLDDILSRTYGCLIYQEQLMKIFKVFASFSDGEADGVRKCVAKKQLDKLNKYLKMFEERALKNGYDKQTISKLIQFIKDNSAYMFNASHAVAYGITTYKTAYLRCNYPLQYMTAIINNQKTRDGSTDFKSVLQYIKACKDDGIIVTPPDVNVSGHKFTPDVEKNTIAYGLDLVKGLGKEAINVVIANRPYTSYKDFINRSAMSIQKNHMNVLIKSGLFRNLIDKNKEYQAKLYFSRRFDERKEEKKPISKVNKTHIKLLLDEGLISPKDQNDKELCLKKFNLNRKSQSWNEYKEMYFNGTEADYEMETLNAFLTIDPFENVVIPDWDNVPLEQVGFIGGYIVSIKETTVKSGKSAGKKMAFININFNGKTADIVVFSNKYQKYNDILKIGKCVVCTVEKQGELNGVLNTCVLLKDYLKATKSIQEV